MDLPLNPSCIIEKNSGLPLNPPYIIEERNSGPSAKSPLYNRGEE